jgi:YVTN family beta-propeller protein
VARSCEIGLNPAIHNVFVSNVNPNDVTVVDGLTHSVMASVPVTARHLGGFAVLPGLNGAHVVT